MIRPHQQYRVEEVMMDSRAILKMLRGEKGGFNEHLKRGDFFIGGRNETSLLCGSQWRRSH